MHIRWINLLFAVRSQRKNTKLQKSCEKCVLIYRAWVNNVCQAAALLKVHEEPLEQRSLWHAPCITHSEKQFKYRHHISPRRRLPINNSFLFIYPLRSINPHFLSRIWLCVNYATKTNKRVAGVDNKSRFETKVDLKVSRSAWNSATQFPDSHTRAECNKPSECFLFESSILRQWDAFFL